MTDQNVLNTPHSVAQRRTAPHTLQLISTWLELATLSAFEILASRPSNLTEALPKQHFFSSFVATCLLILMVAWSQADHRNRFGGLVSRSRPSGSMKRSTFFIGSVSLQLLYAFFISALAGFEPRLEMFGARQRQAETASTTRVPKSQICGICCRHQRTISFSTRLSLKLVT